MEVIHEFTDSRSGGGSPSTSGEPNCYCLPDETCCFDRCCKDKTEFCCGDCDGSACCSVEKREFCCDGTCCSLENGEICCGGTCCSPQDNETCCGEKCVVLSGCEKCVNGEVVGCDKQKNEVCCGGECVVLSKCEKCVNGEVQDKKCEVCMSCNEKTGKCVEDNSQSCDLGDPCKTYYCEGGACRFHIEPSCAEPK